MPEDLHPASAPTRRSLPTTLLWPLAALALLFAFNLFFTPGFFHLEIREGRFYGVPIDILNRGAQVMLLSLGMSLVIATGGVDLSVGAVMAIAGAMAAVLINKTGNPIITVCAALACGLIAGLWNGFLVGLFRLQPIVATLVLMVAGRGIAQLLTDGQVINFTNPQLLYLGKGALLGLPFPAVLALCVFALLAILARKTALGLFVESVGDNEVASRFAGLNPAQIKILVYAISGLCAALAGIVAAANIGGADSTHVGLFLELDAILAAVVGGTSLTGGRFSLVGAMLGALLIQSITTTLYMRDVPAEVAPLPKAIVIIIVCLLQSPEFRSQVAAPFARRTA